MRAVWLAILGACWAWPAFAQALDGPLSAPARKTPAASHGKAATHREATPSSRHRVKAKIAASPQIAAPLALPASGESLPLPGDRARHPVARSDDPVSFGMKWNGANDDALRTRTQNYDGNAAGTGAEVGMKLHF